MSYRLAHAQVRTELPDIRMAVSGEQAGVEFDGDGGHTCQEKSHPLDEPGWSPPLAGYQPAGVPGQPVPPGYASFPPPVAPPKKNTGKIVLAVVGGLVGLCCIGAVAAVGGHDATKDNAAATTSAVTTIAATKQSTAATKQSTTEPAAEVTTEAVAEATTKATKKLTVSQENAVEKAADYLEYTAFSRSGLIKQLKFEGFTTAQATYGVKKVGL